MSTRPKSGPWSEFWISENHTRGYQVAQRFRTGGNALAGWDDWKMWNSTATYGGATFSRSGYITPNFGQLVRSGRILPCTPATLSRTKVSIDSYGNAFGVVIDPLTGRRTMEQQIMRYPGDPSSVSLDSFRTPPEDPYRKAYVALVSDYKGQVASFGAFLAEVEETMGSLANMVDGLESEFLALNHDLVNRARYFRSKMSKRYTRKRMVRAFWREASQVWLTWTFGISPLLSDVRSTSEGLSDLHYDWLRLRKKVHGHATVTTQSSVPIQWISSGGTPATWAGAAETSHKWRVKLSGILTPEGAGRSASGTMGISWSDIPPSIWEAIPYSWLVDYFANVSDHLQIWSAFLSLELSAPTRVDIEDIQVKARARPIQTGSVTFSAVEPVEISKERFKFARTTFDQFDLPRFQLENHMTLSRAVNIASVAVQQAGNTSSAKIWKILGS